mgnify:FL=1
MPKKKTPDPVWHSFCIMCPIKCHIETMTAPEKLTCPIGRTDAEWYVAKVGREKN